MKGTCFTVEIILLTNLEFHTILDKSETVSRSKCNKSETVSRSKCNRSESVSRFECNKSGHSSPDSDVFQFWSACIRHLHQLTVGDFCGRSRPTANKYDLVVRWPGSSYDERIFSVCRRHAMFELETYVDSIIVADSGYIIRNYLMMPLDRVSSSAESLYNESQITTCNPIEILFGIFKRRFPVSGYKTTGVLHNMLQMTGDEIPSNDHTLGVPTLWEEILDPGRIRQQRSSIARDLNPK
ncbi:hypothetical protein ABMA28_009138 [Loxostege sticticalis]|uniref:DDE Tnp4 domain-containing protein n=1 Tax=Loxostege sticticalis TaxID=481309 RepID=A0ABD0SCB0_LOXSC